MLISRLLQKTEESHLEIEQLVEDDAVWLIDTALKMLTTVIGTSKAHFLIRLSQVFFHFTTIPRTHFLLDFMFVFLHIISFSRISAVNISLL